MVRLKDNRILDYGHHTFLRSQLQNRYLTTPFIENIDNRSMKIYAASTNFGKSFCIFNEWSPYFLENVGSIHIHIAPHTETINESEIEQYISNSFNSKSFTPYVVYNDMEINWTHIRESLLNGRKVIMIMTDKKLENLMKEPKSPIEMLVSDYGSEVLLTREESSYGTTISILNYKNNKGYSNNKYTATYITNLIRLHELGANFNGITATPTREQRGEIQTYLRDDFEIINEWSEKKDTFLFEKWIRTAETRNYTTDDYYDVSILEDEIRWLNSKIEWREREIQDLLVGTKLADGDKFNGMISLQTRYLENEDRYMVSTLLDTVRNNHNLINPNYNFIIATDKKWTEYNYKGEETGESGKGNEWLTLMNSNQSQVRILVVINKGTYGINIPSLIAGVSFKNPKAKTQDTKENIIDSGIQFISRFNRSNMSKTAWKNFKILYEEYGSEKAYLYLDTRNTFDFHAPSGDNGYWAEVIERFKQNYCNLFTEAYSQIWDFSSINKK